MTNQKPANQKLAWKYLMLFGIFFALTGLVQKVGSAQEVTAQIVGSITDPSGAIVENAEVTATNLETAYSATVYSGADGAFRFLKLAVGTYEVSVGKDGFAVYKEN